MMTLPFITFQQRVMLWKALSLLLVAHWIVEISSFTFDAQGKMNSSNQSSRRSSSTEILHEEMASVWQWRIDTDPELAAAMGLLSQRRCTHALDPRSLESFQQRLQWLHAALRRVQEQVKRDELQNDDDKLSYDLYIKQVGDYCHYTPLHKTYLCCINRLEGPQTDLPLYARYLPLRTTKEREFYLAFLQAIPVQLQQITSLLQTGLVEQRTPPQVSLEGVVPQIRSMLDTGLQAFTKPIEEGEGGTGGVFPPNEGELKAACLAQIAGPVHEAFFQLANFLETDYIPNLRTVISCVDGYPNGATYYQDCLTFHTTTNMTPDQVHQVGLASVQQVHSDMEKIAKQAGYGLDEYLEHLRTSPDYEPKSADDFVKNFRDITGRIAPALLKVFYLHTLPRMPFEIRQAPAAAASMAPAAYYLAGSSNAALPRPGIFYVNTSELKTRRTYESEALALHEAIPGHHTQAAIQAENENLPAFRRGQEDRRYFEAPCRFPFYTGYIEGWGLHSETLGEELGLYQRPEFRFGQLSMEAIRACRLVVDTGMHAKGWTLQQALEYMLQNTAMGSHDASAEVSRYVTWPGQACAYKVGQLEIKRLRNLAETELGDELFDKRDFYDVVLKCGPVPLDTLETLVKNYIANTKANGGGGGIRAGGGGSQTITGTKAGETLAAAAMAADTSFLETMTFANWCKCCVVPGACLTMPPPPSG